MQAQHPLQARLNLALKAHLAGETADAEAHYRTLLHEAPDWADVHHWLGFLLQQNQRLTEAREHLYTAVSLDPRHSEWHFNLGLTLARLDDPQAAISALQRAVTLAPTQYFYWTNLGSAFETLGEDEHAEPCFIRAQQINPACPDAWFQHAALCLRQQRFDEARTLNCQGLIAAPEQVTSKVMLAQAWHALGHTEAALAVFEQWLAAEPDHPQALHLRAAYLQQMPVRCSPDYVKNTFDGFAHNFDHILGRLRYAGPTWLATWLQTRYRPATSLSVADLGCGTGLAGELLAPYAHRLIGVDLSRAMLDKAAERQVYAELHEADVHDFLAKHEAGFDLLVCLDTLIYVGVLAPFFEEAFTALKPGGHLVFTTETLDPAQEQPWRLNTSGRYSHQYQWVSLQLEQHHLTLVHHSHGAIRNESGIPVMGDFFCVQRL
ncbi:putative TPR repeat methyltransferase [Silvimonas terrae]|uniref:Putative TPR repeat methyltransferase n=1 Tax=Silvimonas terrae TaxID=300266 RepID=A0A840REW1_9NEIS|nr:tetratricopeptide repeat protein [Silvimonas terrae]MBB5190842.1 putative TPR repeat methyltransferase [Silvimonas terrae]